MRQALMRCCIAVALALLLAGCRADGGSLFGQTAQQEPTIPPITPQPVETVEAPGTGISAPAQPTPLPDEAVQQLATQIISNVYARVAPAVVRIDLPRGIGSGFLIDDDGHIVTNYHVVAEAEGDQVLVSFTDLFQTVGQVIGTDPSSDIAVVRVNQLPEDISPVELGSSADLQVGAMAIAIGNPFGQERTVTNGIVSGVGRTIQEPGTQYAIGGAVQTDASINPGNSGGPLLDANGRVIGMNTAILSRTGASTGVGFAVPADLIAKVVPSLIERGQYDHPWLGIQMANITTYQAEQTGLPSAGILIQPSAPDTPVAQAGLEGPAVLTEIDGTPMTSSAQVISYLELQTDPGDTVTLTLIGEDGQQRDLQVQLGARPTIEDDGGE